MPKTITITDVADIVHQNVPCWFIRQERDGGIFGHIMPHSTLALRAAEYGIDPADTALLLDVALHEHHMPPANDTTLEGLLLRLEQAKTVVDITTAPGPTDPLDTIRQRHIALLQAGRAA